MAAHWYPAAYAARIPFHANFNTNAQATGTTYGLSAGQKASILRDKDTVPAVVNFKEAVEAYAEAVTEWAALILEGPIGTPMPDPPTAPTPPSFEAGEEAAIRPRTLQYAGIIKADPEYTDEVGDNYAIVSTSGALTTPEIDSATAVPGTSHIDLSLSKGGYDLVAIDMRRNGGAWTELFRTQTANFTDTTAALVPGEPETREYRAQGVEDNDRVGDLSPIVAAVTAP